MSKTNKRLVYLLLFKLAWMLMPTHATELVQPNVLILLADDMGMNDSGLYQDLFHQEPVSAMPNLEALATEGVRFSRFYTDSTCSASRAALLTGQYPARNGFIPVARGISTDIVTLPDFFHSLGYRTHHVGKWHVGEINEQAKPWHQGFDTSFGFLSQWMLQGPNGDGEPQLKPPTYHNPWLLNEHGEGKRYLGHLEDILTAQTVKLIHTNNHHQPWFIYHAFLAPHTPLQPAGRYLKKFGTSLQGRHRAVLKQLDDNLKLIFDALKQSGQWDNTIIIFASDNGAAEKNEQSNAPFVGAKAGYEEGGIRTPLVIKWHGEFSGQPVGLRTDVISIMDIYPSLKKLLADKQERNIDGFDGVASLMNEHLPRNGLSAPRYFWGFGGLSAFDQDFNHRLIRQWKGYDFMEDIQLTYSEDGIPEMDKEYFFSTWIDYFKKNKAALWDDFLAWRDKVRKVDVKVNPLNHGYVARGKDFLRSPVNSSYAVTFSFKANEVKNKQNLLFQKGIVNFYIENNILSGSVYGLSVQAHGIEANQCYQVVLSGEFYDRYNKAHDQIMPSRIHLILNGKEVDLAIAQLDSLEQAPIEEPTYVGQQGAEGELPLDGFISAPVFFSTQLLPDDKPIPSHFFTAEEACIE